MKTHKYEVVKEYVFFVEGLDHTIRGRILRSLEGSSLPFMWQISHRWKPSEGAGFYYPSATSGRSVEQVEPGLFAYAEAFTKLVKEDPNY